MTTEADLIAACVRGEHRAQRQLYDQLAGLMLTVCRRYLKRREDAEEALLLGFAKMFRALPNYRFEGSFEGWVRRIMVNEALMQLRQREMMTVSFEDFGQPENLPGKTRPRCCATRCSDSRVWTRGSEDQPDVPLECCGVAQSPATEKPG